MAIFINKLLANSLNLIDYRLFYIVVVSFLLGRNQSIISIAVAGIWYLYGNSLNGQELISQLIDHTTLVHIGLYIFIGLTLGYVIDKKEKLLEGANAEVLATKERYDSLTAVFKDTLMVKEELQNQIVYAKNSVGTVYDVMKDLSSLDSEEICAASIRTIEKVMPSSKAAVYRYNKLQERFILKNHSSSLDIPDHLLINEHEMLQEAMNTSSVQVNKELDRMLPIMLAPVYINGTIAGFVGVYETQFEYLTLTNQNLLFIIADLLSSALSCATEHEQLLNGRNKPFNNKEEAYV